MNLFCTQCGHQNEADSSFCEACGKPLIGANASADTGVPAVQRHQRKWIASTALLIALIVILLMVLAQLSTGPGVLPNIGQAQKGLAASGQPSEQDIKSRLAAQYAKDLKIMSIVTVPRNSMDAQCVPALDADGDTYKVLITYTREGSAPCGPKGRKTIWDTCGTTKDVKQGFCFARYSGRWLYGYGLSFSLFNDWN